MRSSSITLSSLVRRLMVMVAILALPVAGYAQATLGGTVKDLTGKALPGVKITALHEASGTTFPAVTDEAGGYRLSVRPGVYTLTAEAAGFATLQWTGLELLVSQVGVANLQMQPSAEARTVTVTGAVPLVAASDLGGNIDPRQMQDLPVNGRNQMDLAQQAAGSRQNAGGGVPLLRQGYSQIAVDGLQVTQLIAGTGDDQPKYSRDSIAEFRLSTSRFDATQGRSAGMVANAISKSGTNTLSGTFSGFFRSDKLNSADFIQGRVLPYSNQQVGGTFGGPIRQDKFHFFGSYEYEREPLTVTYSSQWARFNIDQPHVRRQKLSSLRLDAQPSSQIHLGMRASGYHQWFYTGGGTSHPSSAQEQQRYTKQALGSLTWVVSNRSTNEVRGGVAYFDRLNEPFVRNKGQCHPLVKAYFAEDLSDGSPLCGGSPSISIRGYSFGSAPQWLKQNSYSIRDDYTTSFTAGGRHDVKTGGEFINVLTPMHWCNTCTGTLQADAGNVPANIEDLFPVWDDYSTWNLAALTPITARYRLAVGDFNWLVREHFYATWLQDNWTATSKLTLNLGLRYDMQVGVHAEKTVLQPWLTGTRSPDRTSFGPRLGFAYQVDDKTVIRGGYGKFFTQVSTDEAQQSLLYTVTALTEVTPDGRADFAANPFNGVIPTYDQVIAKSCHLNNSALGCFRREFTSEMAYPNRHDSYSHQSSIGIQRAIGSLAAFEANYVQTNGRGEEVDININMSYDPATGANNKFSTVATRPFPEWGVVRMAFLEGVSDYRGLETQFVKRMANHWQVSATYTLATLKDSAIQPPKISLVNGIVTRSEYPFTIAPDLGRDYTLAATDQRHRATVNGIADLGHGLQLSGLYFFGSGAHFSTNCGCGDARDTGNQGSNRLRANGTIVPRNNLVGQKIHRVDMRVQQSWKLGRRVSLSGIFEMFNVFNHENYGSYTTAESNARFGQPSLNTNVAYQPRMMQLAFRTTF